MTLSPNLPRRAIACPGWEWLPGMVAIGRNGTRWRIFAACGMLCVQSEGAVSGYAAWWSAEWAEVLGALPDLTDGATRGQLLELVRKAWGPLSYVGWDGRQWVVYDHNAATSDDGRAPVAVGGSEAEALVVALERAPVAP